jgi:hypothetical protein
MAGRAEVRASGAADCLSSCDRRDRRCHDAGATPRAARLIAPSWSMAPAVAAYQAMRGVSIVVAVTFAAEIGDVRRFDNARQVTAFVGLVPSERSTGESVRRGGLTLAWQSASSTGADRSSLDLPLPRPRQQGTADPDRGPSEGSSRDCMEGSDSPVRPLSQAHRPRQEETRRRCRHRPQNCRVLVGNRSPRRTCSLISTRGSVHGQDQARASVIATSSMRQSAATVARRLSTVGVTVADLEIIKTNVARTRCCEPPSALCALRQARLTRRCWY